MKILLAVLFFLPGFCHAMNQDELVMFIQQAELAQGYNHTDYRISIFVKAFYVTVNKLVQQGNAITLENFGRFNPRESYDGYCRNPRDVYGAAIPCVRWRSVRKPAVIGHSGFLQAMRETAPSQQYTTVEITRHVRTYIDVVKAALARQDVVESRGFGSFYVLYSYAISPCGAYHAHFPKFRTSSFFLYGTFSASEELKNFINDVR